MAASGERRMLFDVRGRRKHVLRFVYAILALLMAGSLFLTVGPFNISEIVGNGGTTSAADALDEQAERIETRLARKPNDEGLLLNLTRARISAANARIETDPSTGTKIVPVEAEADFEAAIHAWKRYLEQAGGDVSPTAAQLVAGTYFSRAETGSELGEIEHNLKQAAATQRIVAETRPSLGALSTLAIYEYFANDFAAGDKAASKAEAKASKGERKGIEKQLAEYRKRGKAWEKQRHEFAKQQAKSGKESLQNPLSGFSPTGP